MSKEASDNVAPREFPPSKIASHFEASSGFKNKNMKEKESSDHKN